MMQKISKMEKLYTAIEVVEQLGNVDFDFDDGEDSDFEGEGVHSLLSRASLDSVEDGDRDGDDKGDEEDTHGDGDDEEPDPPRPPSPGDGYLDPSSSKSYACTT